LVIKRLVEYLLGEAGMTDGAHDAAADGEFELGPLDREG
jgi:hypothetical protein